MSGLKHVFSKAQRLKPYVKKGSKIAKELADPIGAVAPRVGKALKTGSDLVDLLIGSGYTKAQARRMTKEYTPGELRKMCRGGNPVGGGKLMGKHKLRQRMVE